MFFYFLTDAYECSVPLKLWCLASAGVSLLICSISMIGAMCVFIGRVTGWEEKAIAVSHRLEDGGVELEDTEDPKLINPYADESNEEELMNENRKPIENLYHKCVSTTRLLCSFVLESFFQPLISCFSSFASFSIHISNGPARRFCVVLPAPFLLCRLIEISSKSAFWLSVINLAIMVFGHVMYYVFLDKTQCDSSVYSTFVYFLYVWDLCIVVFLYMRYRG